MVPSFKSGRQVRIPNRTIIVFAGICIAEAKDKTSKGEEGKP